MIDELKLVLAVILGSLATAIPLWAKIRSLNIKFKAETENNALKLKADVHNNVVKEKIDSEAEWKRIIEFRDIELARLRDRDDQQERQLKDLWEKLIQCRASEAAQVERIKANEMRIEALEKHLFKIPKRKNDEDAGDSNGP